MATLGKAGLVLFAQFSRQKLGQSMALLVIVAMWMTSPQYAMSHLAFQWLLIGFFVSAGTLWIVTRDARPHSKLDDAEILRKSVTTAATLSASIGLAQYLDRAHYLLTLLDLKGGGQITALLGQRNQLATLLCMGLLTLAISGANSEGLEPRWKQLLAVRNGLIASLLAFVLATTGSRTGAVELFFIIVCVGLFRKRLPRAAYSIVLVGGLVFVCSVAWMQWSASSKGIAAAGLMARLNDSNAGARWELWANVIELIEQRPLSGHGWRALAYAHYSSEFSGARFMELLDNAHNLPLHLAVELGLPLATFCLGLMFWMIKKSQPWREIRTDRQLAWALLLVIGIHSMVEYPLWYAPFFLTAMLCIAVLWSTQCKTWIHNLNDCLQRYLKFTAIISALLLLSFTTFAALDYHRVSQIYLAPHERSEWYADDPMSAAKKSVLFQSHAQFAELQITPLSRETVTRVFELSSKLVRWSPEPRIIEKLIESAVMLGHDDIAAFHMKRYSAAYPAAYAVWVKRAAPTSEL
jgi:Virulence factor membrane-bound polymerase, C-terminal/O-Antigen ligase